MKGGTMKNYTCETCGWTGDYPAYRGSSVEDGLEWAVCPMDCVYETCGGAIEEVLIRVNLTSPLGRSLRLKARAEQEQLKKIRLEKPLTRRESAEMNDNRLWECNVCGFLVFREDIHLDEDEGNVCITCLEGRDE
jgi:rubredoxin